MSSDSTQAPAKIYGFARRRKHFVWQESSSEQPASSNEPVEPGSDAELLDDVRQLAASGSSVAQGMLRVLESEGLSGTDNRVCAPSSALQEQPPESPDTTEASDPSAASPRPEKSPRRRRKKPSPDSESPLERHERRCAICGTRYQEEIEDAFINWESVDTIARSYGIDRRSVYRHAHATGLFAQRDRNIRRALGLLIHRADKVRDISADSIIRAAKTLAHLNEQGEWTAPPTHVIVSSGAARLIDANSPQTTDLIDTRCHQHPKLTS